MNIPSLQPKPNADVIPLEKLAGNPNVSQDDKVREVSKQFEAVLLRQILSEARKPVIGGSHESSSSAIYDDMVNNQMAQSISQSGAFGLAKSLQTQLVHQVLPNAGQMTPAPTPLKVSKVNHH